MDLRERLTTSKEDFDDIVLGRKLGANSNISSIIHMLRDIAGQVEQGGVTGDMGRQTAFALTEYFDEMRGDSSIAVRNAIGRLMEPVRAEGLSGREFASRLVESCDAYEYESAHWNEKIVACAREVLKDVGTLMVYDYSSTVNAVLQDAEDWGRDIRVYIPESRTLDGGMPFIRNHAGSNLHFSLIQDCAMAYYVVLCDAALVGVETFCGDGGLYNTTGSLSLGILCREYGVPFYGITQFLKMDRRLSEQTPKKLEEYDMSQVLGVAGVQVEAGLDVNCVGIELVPPKYITGYMTEMGYLTPTQAAGMPSLN